jgi:hypothetical protein
MVHSDRCIMMSGSNLHGKDKLIHLLFFPILGRVNIVTRHCVQQNIHLSVLLYIISLFVISLLITGEIIQSFHFHV